MRIRPVGGILVSLAFCCTLAVAQSLPAKLSECETYGCGGEWKFSGRKGTAHWPKGVEAELTIERFDKDQVIIRRRDTNTGNLGATAVYTGIIHGRRISGDATYNWPGHWGNKPVVVQWSATIEEDASIASSRPKPFALAGIWQADLKAENGLVPPQYKIDQTGDTIKICTKDGHGEYCWMGVYAAGDPLIHLSSEHDFTNGLPRLLDVVIENPDRIHSPFKNVPGEVKVTTSRISPPRVDDAACDDANTAKVEAYFAILRAKDAFDRKDPSKFACWLHSGAMQGNARAESLYGGALYAGIGVAPDYQAAFQWAKKGADSHDFFGEFMLAMIYQTGKGAPADPQKSREWLAKFDADFPKELQQQQRPPGSWWDRMSPEQRQVVIRATRAFFDMQIGGGAMDGLVAEQMRNNPRMTRSQAESQVEQNNSAAYRDAQEQQQSGFSTMLKMMLGGDEQLNEVVRKSQQRQK